MKQNRDVYVIGGARTPFVKSMGSYLGVTTQDLMVASLSHLTEKFNLENKPIGDVALGSVMLRSTDFNLARESVLSTKLSPFTPGYNLQRACGTGLEAANHIALKISAGQMELGIAGGVDTNSDLSILFPRSFSQKLLHFNNARKPKDKVLSLAQFRPQDLLPELPKVAEPRTGLSMGEHCELMVKEWKIKREDQDELSLKSHINAHKAYEEGFFDDLIANFKGLQKDGLVRGNTTIDKLAKLKPAFDKSSAGTLTAGNSSSLTDGSSCVLLGSGDAADKYKLPKLAKFVDAEAAALDFVNGDGLLMAPTVAVARLLQRNNLKLQDFDYYEIHEAFAGQVLCTLKAWESKDYCKKYMGLDQALGSIDLSKMNVKGSSIALGHPFAATGGRIVATLAKILNGTKGKRGLISICTAGGMGVAAILESAE